MQIIHDPKAKTITVTLAFDPSATYPVNPKTGKSKTVASSGGYAVVPGTNVKLMVQAIQSNKQG